MKFLEYDLLTGRIISEIVSPIEPKTLDDRGILQINDNDNINTSMYIIKNGALVKTYESKIEKLERERIRNENNMRSRLRLKSMQTEFFIAMMRDDIEAINELKKEFRQLEIYL